MQIGPLTSKCRSSQVIHLSLCGVSHIPFRCKSVQKHPPIVSVIVARDWQQCVLKNKKREGNQTWCPPRTQKNGRFRLCNLRPREFFSLDQNYMTQLWCLINIKRDENCIIWHLQNTVDSNIHYDRQQKLLVQL